MNLMQFENPTPSVPNRGPQPFPPGMQIPDEMPIPQRRKQPTKPPSRPNIHLGTEGAAL